MLYATETDIERCMNIVSGELKVNKIDVDVEVLKKITIDIMRISYSKGGDYTSPVIGEYARTYVEDELYKKFIK